MTLTAAPPETSQPRLRRIAPPLALAGGVLLLSVALHVRDPHQSGSWGFCPWLVVTGTYCPGCGGLRAVNDLTRGDPVAAVSSNLLFVAAIPLAVAMWARSLRQRWRGVRSPLSNRAMVASASVASAVILVFWVVRNLPFGAWLAP